MQNLFERNPFSEDPTLHSIATCTTANESVNVDMANEIWESILTSMVEKDVYSVIFKRNKYAVRMNDI